MRVRRIFFVFHAMFPNRDYHYRVLQYIHDSLVVGGESDRSLYPSKGVVAYGSKEDLILNAMVGFYLNELW